ncbi:TPA: hypothetical protein N0F65_010024 [Lagenidium giganteum]|uniref:WRKY19-like zinc finger domain-containing protein n=1 Tax=Lagenidium giganteum TaxID=4803 RepID=A0AAV2ZI30_9STRA|nr:TPA: hypothetical protein N0F65_010024 [Lagenidium giganteum]
MGMMKCVDTSLFSQQQLQNWEQMKARIKLAAENKADGANAAASSQSSGHENESNIDYRSPLHREASIQDVLACLLDQQPPSFRVMNSNGGSFLVNSEVKKAHATAENKPTLKSLLSSNNFSMTEKKESLKHLLSFIDTSFASNPEPMTDVYKESKEGNLQRLSSLQLMRSFLPPSGNMQGMGRTTSFEIIQAMLNATSNQAIQKPMSSQDSFRFQHLANCLEAIESDVAYDNEDYGSEEVVQVDNLDNLLEYHGPPSSAPTAPAAAAPTPSLGFVDTQSLINPSRSIYNEIGNQGMYQSYPGGSDSNSSNMEPSSHQMPYQQQQLKMEPNSQLQYQQQILQQQHQQQQQFNQMQFQTMMQSQVSAATLLANTRKGQGGMTQQYNPLMMQQQAGMHQAGGRMVGTPMMQTGAAQKKETANGVQLCSALGCNHVAKIKGMCKLHGGGRRCKVEGCMKSAQTGHLCIAHGGGKPCNVDGCPKTAQSRGLCKQHGGGVRCKFEGCTKSCQSGGFCRGHGGGKRCEFPNCTKWAQKNGHCAKHAQEMAQKMGMGHP